MTEVDVEGCTCEHDPEDHYETGCNVGWWHSKGYPLDDGCPCTGVPVEP